MGKFSGRENGASAEAKDLARALMTLDDDVNAAPVVLELVRHGAVLDYDELSEYSDPEDFYSPCKEGFIEEMIALMHGESTLTDSELDMITAAYTGNISALGEILTHKPNVNL